MTVHKINWIDRIYDETMSLLAETKAYHENLHKKYSDYFNAIEKCVLSQESLRITSRLSHTMAWLLNEKAILASELTLEEARTRFRPLVDENVCIDCHLSDLSTPHPAPMLDLLERSHCLFMKAARLETQLRKDLDMYAKSA